MNDVQEQVAEKPIKAPAKKPARKRAKPRRQAKPAEPKPIATGEFAGVSSTNCCTACTAERCMISTVAICKHPNKAGDSGCGPITMANREKVRKLIKHQIIDLKG